jgi:hypothetical protein
LRSVRTYDDNLFIDGAVYNRDALDTAVSHVGPLHGSVVLRVKHRYGRIRLAPPLPLLKHKFTLSAPYSDLLGVETGNVLIHRDTYASMSLSPGLTCETSLRLPSKEVQHSI